jgi:predicted GIY-YIG superfamily endonuclease
MKNNPYYRLIYAFEFPDNSVYVGLTYNSTERKNEHLNTNKKHKTSVCKHIEKTGVEPIFKELTEFIDRNEASKLEGEVLEIYKNNGWKILNRVKTGGLGGNRRFWSKTKCLEVAKKCKYKSEFIKKFSGAYESALKNGWIDICCDHMKRAPVWNKRYDLNMCLSVAKICQTRGEFQKKYNSAYQAARKNGWLVTCVEHMVNPKIFWTYEKCVEKASKYNKRSEFKRTAAGAYDRAKTMGWLNICCQHMK